MSTRSGIHTLQTTAMSKTTTATASLPPDVIAVVAQYVDSDTLVDMSWVCKDWRSAITDHHFKEALRDTNPLFQRSLTFRKTFRDCALTHRARMKSDRRPLSTPLSLDWSFCEHKHDQKLPWDFYCLGKFRAQDIENVYSVSCLDTHNYGLHDSTRFRVAPLTINLYNEQWWIDTLFEDDVYTGQYGLTIHHEGIAKNFHMIASTPEMLVVLIDEKKPKILIKYAESQETTYVVDDYNKDFDSETFVFAAGSVAIFRTVDEDFIEQFYVLAGSGATPLYSRKKPVFRRMFYFIYDGTIWEIFDQFQEGMMVIQDLFFNLPSMSFKYDTSHDKKKWKDSNITMDYNWWAVHDPCQNYRYVVIYGVYNAKYVIDMLERKVITWDCTVTMSDRLLVGISQGKICTHIYSYDVLYSIWKDEVVYEDGVSRVDL
ncbi:hypothetical protein B0I72DRAFT_107886 [Yarrowia lipolytica]|nr:hypothetical protein B0I72DRAFT_107886 [Yarrowia lipolytica]RDW37218.1 hypothetical protein B0I73DRAFT_123844 [Yarrowia lipolytica]RDW45510.1 hypothetical protein B0I74DRAFT_163961 [Yarrowia lipolytica]RDW52110.1 hypothetical protein B0I75DRAFT_164679 [Yarrowia lipolytica]